jgi:nucleoside-diphosphate-sugar epimerase
VEGLAAMSRPARRVLVTGHDGYIGAVLVPALCKAGYEVAGLDTCFYDDGLFGAAPPSIPTVRKDVRDLTRDDLRGVDAIVHLAALSNDPLGALSPALTLAINHEATVRLATEAREAGVRRFLFASSCSIYGASDAAWADEESPVAPLTAYAESKVKSEPEVVALADEDFVPTVLRCATVYGVSPRLRTDLVVNNLAAWAVTAGEIRIMSDGTPWRPLIHVEDLASAYVRFIELPASDLRGLTVNVGFDEQNYQVRDVAAAVRRAASGTEVVYAGTGEPDRRSYRVRFARFREVAALAPQWDVERGAAQVVEAFRRHGFSRRDFDGPKFTRLRRLTALLESGRLDAELRWTRR